MYKKVDYRALIGALVFVAGLLFLIVAGSASAQQVVDPEIRFSVTTVNVGGGPL